MAWYDNVGSWFGGGDAGGNNGSFDWFSGGGSGGGNWWDSVGDGWLSGGDSSGGSSESSSGGWMSTIGKWLGSGGDGKGSNTNGSNIFGAMLGGVGGMAEGLLSEKAVKEAGKQTRKNYSYQAELQDFYAQKGKARKRAALDTYGQFSLMDRWAPNATAAPPVDVPNKPQE